MIDHVVPIHVYKYSRSIYECLTRNNRTTEKRFLIDLFMLRQNYERREITEVFWIPTKHNPSDKLTKDKLVPALTNLIEKNRIVITLKVWI